MCLKGSLKVDSSSISVMDIEDDHRWSRSVGVGVYLYFVEMENVLDDYFHKKEKKKVPSKNEEGFTVNFGHKVTMSDFLLPPSEYI